MKLSYDILLTVSFQHDYFSNEKTDVFTVSPAAATAEYMRKEGLICKSQPCGFVLLFNRHYAGSDRSKEQVLALDIDLFFYVTCTEPSLLSYTNLPDEYQPGESCFYFTNRKENTNEKLHVSEYVSSEDICREEAMIPKQLFKRPFGIISLLLKEVTANEYRICFSVKTTYWRYVLVSDYIKELQQPAILDKEEAIAFAGPSSLRLPDEKEALAFTSQSPIAMSQKPDKFFRLVENYNGETGKYKTVLQRLPYPDIKHISLIGSVAEGESHSQYSNIII